MRIPQFQQVKFQLPTYQEGDQAVEDEHQPDHPVYFNNPSRVELGMLYSGNRGFDRPLFAGTYCTFTTHAEEFLAS